MLYMYWMLDTLFFFFFNDTATTEIYTLSLHDALPISPPGVRSRSTAQGLLDGPPRENAGEVPPVLARRGDVRGGARTLAAALSRLRDRKGVRPRERAPAGGGP